MNLKYVTLQLAIVTSIFICGIAIFNYYDRYTEEWDGLHNKTIPVLMTLENLRASGLLVYGTTVHIEKLIQNRQNKQTAKKQPTTDIKEHVLSQPLNQDTDLNHLNNEKNSVQAESLIFLSELDEYSRFVKESFPDETDLLEKIKSSARKFWTVSKEIVYPDDYASNKDYIAMMLNLNSTKNMLLHNINTAIQHEMKEIREINQSLQNISKDIKAYFYLIAALYTVSFIGYFVLHRNKQMAQP